MKTISLDAIIFLVSFSMLHSFIASKKCLLEFFFFNSFLSIAMFLRVTEEHLDVEKGKTLGQVDVYLHEERRNFGIKTTPANKFPEFKEARRISSFLASFKILRIMECYLFQFPACFPTVFVLLFHISQTPLRARSGISPKTKLGQVDEYFPGRQRLGTNFDNILKAAIKVGMQKYA